MSHYPIALYFIRFGVAIAVVAHTSSQANDPAARLATTGYSALLCVGAHHYAATP
jgi:hypothetical protein